MPALAVPFPGQSGASRHVHVLGNAQEGKDPAQHGLVVLQQIAAAHYEHLMAGEVLMQVAQLKAVQAACTVAENAGRRAPVARIGAASLAPRLGQQGQP